MENRGVSILGGVLTIILAIMLTVTPAISANKVIKLTISDHNPPFTPTGKAIAAWVEKINEMGKDRLELTLHPGGALLSGEEAYRGVQAGVVDAAHYVVDTREGFILNLITGLPFMGWPDRWVAGEMYQQLLDKSEAMRAEWEGVTILSFLMMPGTHLHTAKKPIITPADLKGKKIMGSETTLNAVMQAVGATPIQLDIGDMSPSLSTGLIDGVMNHINVIKVFGALELLPYHTYFGGGITFTPIYLIMNTKKLNSLPPDLNQLMIDSGSIWYDALHEMEIGFGIACQKEAEEMKHTFNYLTPEQIALWYNLVKGPVHDQWMKDAASKGRPGKEVYEMALNLIKNHNK